MAIFPYFIQIALHHDGGKCQYSIYSPGTGILALAVLLTDGAVLKRFTSLYILARPTRSVLFFLRDPQVAYLGLVLSLRFLGLAPLVFGLPVILSILNLTRTNSDSLYAASISHEGHIIEWAMSV